MREPKSLTPEERKAQIEKARAFLDDGTPPPKRPSGLTLPKSMENIRLADGTEVRGVDDSHLCKVAGTKIKTGQKTWTIGERAMVLTGTYDGDLPEVEPAKIAGAVGWGTVVGVVVDPFDPHQPVPLRMAGFEASLFGTEAYNNRARMQHPDAYGPGEGPISADGVFLSPAVLLDEPTRWGLTCRDDVGPDHVHHRGRSLEDVAELKSEPKTTLCFIGGNGSAVAGSDWEALKEDYEILDESDYCLRLMPVFDAKREAEIQEKATMLAMMVGVDHDVAQEVLKEIWAQQ